jgi:hypothetical protein
MKALESKPSGFDAQGTRGRVDHLLSLLTEVVDLLRERKTGLDLHQNQKQLKEISKSIDKLEQINVQIPAELMHLRGALLSQVSEAEEVDSVLRYLTEELSGLQNKVRSSLSPGGRQRNDSREPAPWSGYWFVNVGEGPHRNWDDNRRYGFIGAGQGEIYSRPLQNLRPGYTIFAYMSGLGYVGYGEVLRPAEPIKDFIVDTHHKRLLELSLDAPKADENSGSLDLSEWVVPVRWIQTFDRENAKTFRGVFANQNIVCKLRHEKTIEFLRGEFGADQKELPHKPVSSRKAS